MDTTKAITHVSLCAGYGGIDLGLKRAIPSLRTIAFSEIEAFACANLVAKMEAGLLDPAPLWTDLKTFPWADFHGCVDILSGGYPCQPFSAAGKRLGSEDPRHLWPFIADGIAAMRPSCCFFENVEGHISLGLPNVIEDLAGLGYRTTWGIFSASEVGAPHQRKRVFILAYRISEGSQGCLRSIHLGLQGEAQSLRSVRASSVLGDGEAWRDASGSVGIPSSERCEQTERAVRSEQQASGTGEVSWQGSVIWPSRPGEQQFWWEPPRVVVDAKSQRAGQRSELRGEERRSRSALPRDVEQSGEGVVANDHSAHAGHGEQRPERALGDLSGGCGEELEHANGAHAGQNAGADCSGEQAHQGQMGQGDEQRQFDGSSGAAIMGNASHTNRRTRVSAEEAGVGPDDIWRRRSGESGDGAMGISEDGNTRRDALQLRPGQAQHRGASGSIDQGRREALAEMGRGIDGTQFGSRLSELSGLSHQELAEIREWMVRSDNRTDELRLLGNGVVPATAERAFRTLVSELMEYANQ